MMVKSRITINNRKIRQLTQAAITALEQTGEALHSEVQQAQVIPRKKGTLQGESFFEDHKGAKVGIVELIQSTPYARRLYYHPEYHFDKSENPNARGAWFEDWLPGGKDAMFCMLAFKKFYKKAGGL